MSTFHPLRTFARSVARQRHDSQKVLDEGLSSSQHAYASIWAGGLQ